MAVGKRLLQPEEGWKRYNDRGAPIQYIPSAGWAESTHQEHYLGTCMGSVTSVKDNYFEFSFIGSKLRLIITMANTYSNRVEVVIDDNEPEYFDANGGRSFTTCIVGYQKMNLEYKAHDVRVKVINKPSNSAGYDYRFEAIDIDSTGRLIQIDEVYEIKDIDIGKRIRCNYVASSNSVGSFRGLGQATSDFIPFTGSSAPNGDFYYICVDKDHLGRWKLIADRVLQINISWDTLNTAGIASGNGTAVSWVGLNPYDKNSRVSVSNYNLFFSCSSHVSSVRATEGKTFGKWYWEITQVRTANNNMMLGVSTKEYNLSSWEGSDYWIRRYSGESQPAGTVWSFLLDIDRGTLTVYRNNSSPLVLNLSSFMLLGNPVFPTLGLTTRTGLNEAKINFGTSSFVYEIPDGFKPYDEKGSVEDYITRLLTGGVSSADQDNEWDKYIVNSTLEGKITAGDDKVWNWSPATSWASTTVSGTPANRTGRGRNNLTYYGTATSNFTGNTTGFRPVLLIKPPPYKILIEDQHTLKTFKRDLWEIVEGGLTESNFYEHGMDNLREVIASNALDLLSDTTPKVYILTDVPQINAKIDAVPFPKIVFPKDDIDLSNVNDLRNITLDVTTAGAGILRIIASVDKGQTWESFNGSWFNVDHLNLDDVKGKGISSELFNSLGSIEWSSLINDSDTLRLAFYLELDSVHDTVEVNSLISSIELKGKWRSAVHGRQYEYEYTGKTLTVELLSDGTYKINY